MTVNINNYNGLQGGSTDVLLPSSVWRNSWFCSKMSGSASNKHLCLVESLVFLNPPLHLTAKRNFAHITVTKNIKNHGRD